MLMAMADLPYVTASALRIGTSTSTPLSSQTCCRANMAMETHSAISATSSQPGSAPASTGQISSRLGTLSRTLYSATAIATTGSSLRSQRLIPGCRTIADATASANTFAQQVILPTRQAG